MLLSISNVFPKEFDITVIIVDNSNSINTRTFFETRKKISNKIAIKICKNNNNGYLKGLSTGAKLIPSNKTDFVFLCNPDLEFQKCDWLGILSSYQDTRILLAPQIITPNGENQIQIVKSFSKLEIFVQDISTWNYGTYKFLTKARKLLKVY